MITIGGKQRYLGYYDDEEAAAIAYDVEARANGKEPNFGGRPGQNPNLDAILNAVKDGDEGDNGDPSRSAKKGAKGGGRRKRAKGNAGEKKEKKKKKTEKKTEEEGQTAGEPAKPKERRKQTSLIAGRAKPSQSKRTKPPRPEHEGSKGLSNATSLSWRRPDRWTDEQRRLLLSNLVKPGAMKASGVTVTSGSESFADGSGSPKKRKAEDGETVKMLKKATEGVETKAETKRGWRQKELLKRQRADPSVSRGERDAYGAPYGGADDLVHPLRLSDSHILGEGADTSEHKGTRTYIPSPRRIGLVTPELPESFRSLPAERQLQSREHAAHPQSVEPTPRYAINAIMEDAQRTLQRDGEVGAKRMQGGSESVLADLGSGVLQSRAGASKFEGFYKFYPKCL